MALSLNRALGIAQSSIPPQYTSQINMGDVTTSEPSLLHLAGGTVRGTIEEHGVRRFLNIPYAAAPVGPNRFAEPAPPAAWEGERDGTKFGPTAPQRPYDSELGKLLNSDGIPGEDILSVNIWTPASAHKRPVAFWIHGGALERGSSAQPVYDGAAFARDGIVFVSINYRLGAEGFSILEGAPTNLGLHDCVAALKWVTREISAAGGDASRITVFGESAGGALVGGLLALPEARPMIANAIIQSGPLEAQPQRKAARVTRALARILKTPATREAWCGLTQEDLVGARRTQAIGTTAMSTVPGFVLTVDDQLPVSPHKKLCDPATDKDIPLLIGSTTDEYRLFLTPEQLAKIGWAAYTAARWFLWCPYSATLALWRNFPGASYGEILGQMLTEHVFRLPAVRVAEANPTTTWMYEFAWNSPVRDLRAAHALEIGFAFDNLNTHEALNLAGKDAPQHLADEMHAVWIRFMKTGKPGWEAYGAEKNVRVFNNESSTQPLPRADIIAGMGFKP